MGAPSVDIKDILVAGGVGVFATNIFIGSYPEVPDLLVAIYDTGGWPSSEGLDAFISRPTVQVKVRASRGDYTTGWDKAQEVVDALHRLNNETWNGSRYLKVSKQGDILYLGTDDQGRPEFSVNFDIMRP